MYVFHGAFTCLFVLATLFNLIYVNPLWLSVYDNVQNFEMNINNQLCWIKKI